MNIQEYTQLIKEIKNKKGINWDDSIASLAIYKLIENSVLKDFYRNLSITKLENKSYGIVQLSNNNRVSHVGLFKDGTLDPKAFNGDDSVFKMHQANNAASYIGQAKPMMTSEKKQASISLHKAFSQSNNFKELLENIDVETVEQVYSSVNYKTRDFLTFATEYKKSIQLREAKIKYFGKDQLQIKDVIQSGLSNDLEAFFPIFGNIYKSSQANINMAKSAVSSILLAENGYTRFDDISYLMFYDRIDAMKMDSDSLKDAHHAERHYKHLLHSPEFKDSTVLGIVFNYKNDFIPKLIDNLIFDDLKRSILFETKMMMKEKTLQEVYESNPIIDEIYKEAIKIDQNINKPLDEQFKHTIEKDVDGVDKTDFMTSLDNAKLYNNFEKKQLLVNGFPSGKFQNIYTLIQNELDVVRFVGSDNYSPRYIMCGTKSGMNWSKDITYNNECILLDMAMFSQDLDKSYVREALDNLYFYCKENKLVLEWSMKDLDLVFNGYEDVFNEIKEKYKGLVISCDYKDERKFRAISLIDLPLKDILKLEPVIENIIKDPAVYSFSQIRDKVMEHCQKTNFKPSNP